MRTKIRSIGLVFICFNILIFSLAFITLPVRADSKQPVTITFWYTENDAEKKGITDLVADFEAANPDIQVEALQKGFFDAKSLYISAFIAGNEPELFRAARDWVSEFAVAGMIAPLTSELNQTELDSFLPIALRYITYPDNNGVDQIWAIPQLLDTPALMLNKHFFTEAGINVTGYNFSTSWTWDEYLDICKILTNTSAVEYATTLAGMFFGAQPIYFGHGAKLFDGGIVDINHIAINSTESRNALQFLYDFVNASYTPPWTEQGWTPLNQYFAETGRAAMIAQGPWELKNFLDNSPEFNPTVDDHKIYASADNLVIIQLPHDEFGNSGAPVGGQNYVISAFATGPKYDAAVKLAKFLTTEEAMAFKAKEYYHVPARKGIMNRTDVQSASSYPYVQGYYQAVLNAYQTPVSNFWANLEEDFANQIDEYLTGEINLNQCIKQTIDLWKEALGQSVITGTGTSNPGYTEEVPGFEFLLIVGLTFPIITIVVVYRKKRH